MDHVLDNPLFNALASGNKHFANGTDDVKYFPKEVSPFAGTKDLSTTSIAALYNMLPAERAVVFITAKELEIPKQWELIHQSEVYQMTGYEVPVPTVDHEAITPLSINDVAQMLTLTTLTNPGPFEERTIEFGNYAGIFSGDKLVAMAGHRLHIDDYIEISAVCTEPDHLGKGYARALLLYHVKKIRALGKTPFLHVRTDNTRAIEVYKNLGFTVRKQLNVRVLLKK